jgi:sigma-B regulation protein RsbU (phosphoserine phosphatase)
VTTAAREGRAADILWATTVDPSDGEAGPGEKSERRRIMYAASDLAVALTGAEFGAFFCGFNGDSEESLVLCSLSPRSAEAFAGLAKAMGSSLYESTVRHRRTVRMDDVASDPRYVEPGASGEVTTDTARSYLGVPVAASTGPVHGAIFLAHPRPGAFEPKMEALVSTVAGHAGLAIDYARLAEEYEEARAHGGAMANRLGRIQAFTTALSRAVTVQEVADVISQDGVPEVRTRRRGLWLLDDERAELRLPSAFHMAGLEDYFGVVSLDAPVPVAAAVRRREPLFIETTAERDRQFPAAAGIPALGESVAMLPLMAEDRVLGVLGLGFEEECDFDEGERRFLVAMAEQCAVALERALLYDSERRARAEAERDRRRAQELSHALQTSLLPPELPTLPGVELAARYLPALPGVEVGGDFYDVFDTGGDWAVLIGDVCGKGAEAAAMTALVRYTLRSIAMDFRRPAQVLRKLNELLIHHQIGDRFCTVAYARVIPTVEGIRVSVCRGGHPPPLVLRASGEVEAVGAHGSLIGAFPDIRLWEETAQLLPGDSLVFYTDGVIEASRGKEQFGQARLMGVLAESVGLGAAALAERVEVAVVEFGAARPRDDLALLVLRVPG